MLNCIQLVQDTSPPDPFSQAICFLCARFWRRGDFACEPGTACARVNALLYRCVVVPQLAGPTKRRVTAPVKPSTTALAKPGTTAPVKTETVAPVKPGAVAPVKTETVAPVKPGAVAPSKTIATAPMKPGSTTPVKPGAVGPAKPKVTVPVQRGFTDALEEPGVLAPVKPATTAPVKTGVTLPAAITPVQRGFVNGLEEPGVTEPVEKPAATVPGGTGVAGLVAVPVKPGPSPAASSAGVPTATTRVQRVFPPSIISEAAALATIKPSATVRSGTAPEVEDAAGLALPGGTRPAGRPSAGPTKPVVFTEDAPLYFAPKYPPGPDGKPKDYREVIAIDPNTTVTVSPNRPSADRRAGGWIPGRATFYGASKAIDKAYAEAGIGEPGMFGVIEDGSCGFTELEGADGKNLPYPIDMYAAAADTNIDYAGSCGRCYQVRKMGSCYYFIS